VDWRIITSGIRSNPQERLSNPPEVRVPFKIVNLTCDPPSPKAGSPFRLTIQLDQDVQGNAIKVSLEKQRIVLSIGGAPELRPTGPDYFEAHFDPNPITVKAGSRTGTSDPIEVKKMPSAESGEPPIAFPERLLFTAFDTGTVLSTGFCVLVVPILAP